MSISASDSKNANVMFVNSRKNVMGESIGSVMRKNRWIGPAPSISAASPSSLGTPWSAAR
jgi:hypothetical protein